ncbi:MAG: FkbM family methyltransferase [Opitutae bacterium]|nr:FkbM family methyltransferase [Opitutae bacterium]
MRKTSLYSFLLKTRLDRPRLTDLGLPFPVAIRPLTHASIRWAKQRQEPEIAKLFTQIVKALDRRHPKRFFYDVGANHGHYSWLALSQSQNMEVMAFEPDPKNLELLRLTVDHSSLNQVRIQDTALSDKTGMTRFHQDRLTSATGMIDNGDTPWIEKYLGRKANSIEVKRSMLDSFCNPKTKPSLIKIDVEGHELEVLKGGQECLLDYKPILIIESFPPRQEEVIHFLCQLGYEIRDAERNTQVSDRTNNLLAWNKAGPLPSSEIRGILQS